MVGAFVLVLGAAFVAGVLWIASGGAFQKKVDLYLAVENESVAGLTLNAPVKYNGVDVGKVQDMRLAPGNPGEVRLIFAIDRGTPIKDDTVAVLKVQGLTGIAYVELSGGAPESPMLTARIAGDLPEIRTKPSLSARLENLLGTLISKLDSSSDSFNKVLSPENVAAFKSTLADLAAVSHTIAARRESIDAGIASAARTFDSSAKAAAQLGPAIERVGRSAEAVEKMGNEAALASASAGRSLEAAGPELQRLLGEMNALSASLRRLSEKIEGSPGGLLLGRSPVPEGPGEGKMR